MLWDYFNLTFEKTFVNIVCIKSSSISVIFSLQEQFYNLDFYLEILFKKKLTVFSKCNYSKYNADIFNVYISIEKDKTE